MNGLFKTVLNGLWSFSSVSYSDRIIFYHSVSNTGERSHSISAFRNNLHWLRENGFESVLMSDIPLILSGQKQMVHPWVAITFDDGYIDNVEEVLPILFEYGYLATFYIVTSWVDEINHDRYRAYGDLKSISSEAIYKLASAGMEIGCHTHYHQMATKTLEKGRQIFIDEISKSVEVLEKTIGKEIKSFSYPNGQRGAFSSQTKEITKELGFETACTTIWGTVHQKSDLLLLPRCEMSHLDTQDDFVAKMTGRRDYLSFIQSHLKRQNFWEVDKKVGILL